MPDEKAMTRRKISFQEKRSKLQDELKAMKQRLIAIEEKRKNELGELLLKCGLADYDDSVLESEFKAISEKLQAMKNSAKEISA